MIVGERFIPGVVEGDVRSGTPELLEAMERLGPVPKTILEYLSWNFQASVPDEELYERGMGFFTEGDWHDHLWINIFRVREALPKSLSLYTVNLYERYILDYNRPVGSWFITNDRMSVIAGFRDDIQPLMAFCNQVHVRDEKRLDSRLTPIELHLSNKLGSDYPDAVSSDHLTDLLWSTSTVDYSNYYARENLWVTLSRLRDKVRGFEGEAFDIVADNGAYRFAPQEETEAVLQ